MERIFNPLHVLKTRSQSHGLIPGAEDISHYIEVCLSNRQIILQIEVMKTVLTYQTLADSIKSGL